MRAICVPEADRNKEAKRRMPVAVLAMGNEPLKRIPHGAGPEWQCLAGRSSGKNYESTVNLTSAESIIFSD
jgi:hypothetical protein